MVQSARVYVSMFVSHSEENWALRNFADKYQTVFAIKDEPLTVTLYYSFTISERDDTSVARKPYPIPIKYHEEIEQQLKEL